ncbi:MAG: bifunctional serine/threonine-protein kinase/formylglycine-generating enzyme family protein [bacterium]|nr:bifunctional serine/threonine-protein kinase/formylglycine-generating enzyme family protein [bacterium]
MICNKCQIELPEQTNDSLCPECSEETTDLQVSAIDIIFKPHYKLGKRYEIINPIGRGGIGIVYKAKDYILDEIVALKVLAPGLSMNKEIVERFKQETKITRRLVHNNIIRIYDIGKIDNRWYLSMEYIDGKNLKSILEQGPLSIVESIGIIKQALRALDVVHNNHIINRDVKPQNILIGKDGIVKIGDFSIARSADINGLTCNDMMIIGSPEYMSPEQVEGKEIDNRTDIYSVGIVMYEMLTGKPPFESDTLIAIAHKQIFEFPTPPKDLNPQIPVWLDNIILKCLSKEPANRYQDVGELISDLENHRVPKLNFEQKKDEVAITKKTLLKLKEIVILSLIGIFIALGITGYFIQKYYKSQETLQTAQKDFIDNARQVVMLQTKLKEIEMIKQDLETQVQDANQKTQKSEEERLKLEEEKSKLMTELLSIRNAVQKGTPQDMALVGAGEFIMGSVEDGEHKVYLDAFYIDKYEVTNEEYVKFLNAIGKHENYIGLDSQYCRIEKTDTGYKVKNGYERHPVVAISWYGANMYAQWSGKRLPTTAEWEKAARGTDGRQYPWGNVYDRNKCNVQLRGSTPVGNYPEGKSPYGCYDLAGNALEWTADWYSSDYYKNPPLMNPKGPSVGNYRIWRGGSWLGNQWTTKCSLINYLSPENTQPTAGFRCAKDYK